MKKLNKILKDSSLPGIPRMLENDHFIIKFIWIICLIGLTGLSVYYLIINVISYLSYSFVTNIAVISETTPQFPTISFCITSRIQLPTPQNSLYSCTFDSKQCTFKDFEISTVNLVNNNFFDTCLRFNSGKNYSNQSTEIKTISRTNIYTGLNVTFLLDDFVIDGFLFPTIYKLRISIDNYTSLFNRLQIYDQKFGIDIPLGNTQIKIEREYYQNLPEPYNNCIKQDTSEYISYLFQYFIQNNKIYKQINCFDLCIIEFLNIKCNCTQEFKSFQMCFNDKLISKCINDYYFQFLNKQMQMPDKCLNLCPIECDSINKMQLFDLISSVGGLISLFLGFSFLTLIEFIDVIFKICFFSFNNKIMAKQNEVQ